MQTVSSLFNYQNSTILNIDEICIKGTLSWWITKVSALFIGIIGVIANMFCLYLLTTLKSYKKSSYIYYFKFLCITDSFCLIFELLKSLNDFYSLFYNIPIKIILCQLLNCLIASFHLASAWLICAFSIERCIAVNCPLLIRQMFNLKRTKCLCLSILFLAILLQFIRFYITQIKCKFINKNKSTIKFYESLIINLNCYSELKCDDDKLKILFLKFHFYVHQLIFLIIIPTLIVTISNSIVFYRIIERRNMLESGLLQSSNKYGRNRIPHIRVSMCQSFEPELDIKSNKYTVKKVVKNIKRLRGDSNGNIIDDPNDYISISTTMDDSKTIETKSKNNKSKIKNTKQYRKAVKKKREIKLALLMLFSISFLILVLPEALLKIYLYHFFDYSFILSNKNEYLNLFCSKYKTNRLTLLFDVFFILKLLNYSSNIFVYFTLNSFSKVRFKSLRRKFDH